jgi:hypothetical protein
MEFLEQITPRGTLYPQKLAVTSPTSGGRSVGVVRYRTQATELEFFDQIARPNYRGRIIYIAILTYLGGGVKYFRVMCINDLCIFIL